VSIFPFVAAVIVGTLGVIVFLIPDRRVGARPSPTRGDYGSLRKFSVTVSVRALGIGAVGSFYGTFAAALGANALEISAIAIAGLATGAVVALPFGRWVDRAGEIRSIRIGTFITLGGIALFFVATSWPVLLPAGALRLAGISLLSPAMLTWVARRAPADRRAEYLGVFSSINSTMWSLGPLFGAAAFAVAGPFGLISFAVGTTIVSLVGIELMYGDRGRSPDGGVAADSTGSPLPGTEPATPVPRA
jgi:MFS family permease